MPAALKLSVARAATTTAVAAGASLVYSAGARTIPVAAAVTGGGGSVGGGTVAFTLVNVATNQAVAGTSVAATVAGGSTEATLPLPAGLGTGTYEIVATYGGMGNFAGSADDARRLTIPKATPVLVWANPAAIVAGTALSAVQLNAFANTAGTLTYTPAAGTVLAPGLNQTLTVSLHPADSANHADATTTVSLNVLVATSTTLTLAATKATYLQPTTLGASVAAVAGGAPAGSITFLDGTRILGTSAVDSAGRATLTTSALPPGVRSIAARYSGDSTRAASLSPVATIAIDGGVKDDLDGDRRTDYSVFRPLPAKRFVLKPATGGAEERQIGVAGDVPVPGQYFGPGRAVDAVYRPGTSTFYLQNPAGGLAAERRLGDVGDVPVPADYDGDGTTDTAVFDPATATFLVYHSATGTLATRQWGVVGDVAMPADYDGDGRADCAVFRPSTQVFYLLNPATGGARAGSSAPRARWPWRATMRMAAGPTWPSSSPPPAS